MCGKVVEQQDYLPPFHTLIEPLESLSHDGGVHPGLLVVAIRTSKT